MLLAQSHVSARDKDDSKLKRRAVHRSPGKLWKTLARRPSDEGCTTGHRLNWGPLLPNDIGRIAQHSRKEGRKVQTNVLKRHMCDSHAHVFVHLIRTCSTSGKLF